MAVLYVTDEGACLTRQGEQIVVVKRGRVIQAVHGFKLQQVVAFGNVHMTCGVRNFLLDAGIETLFLTQGGRLRGRLVPLEGRNIDLRREQFRRLEDPVAAADLARRFVYGKLHNCRTLLRRHHRTHPAAEIESAMHRLRHAATHVMDVASLDEIRGWEGAGAAAYFGCFRHLIQVDGFPFSTRDRRPPRDAVNSMLSFGYTLLLGTVNAAVLAAGLDPYLGSLHAPDNGKPSMVLDLMEEFRPLLVDSTALRAINRRQILAQDFQYQDVGPTDDFAEGETPSREDYPVLMGSDTMRKWIVLYEGLLKQTIFHPSVGMQLTWRDVCLEQARRVARHLRGEETYEPFMVR